MESRLRTAVVGLGHIGKRHAALIQEMPAFDLVAAVEPNPARWLQLQKFTNFQSTDALLNSGLALDLVSIATPNDLHCSQAIQFLEAGVNVLLEKPMGLTSPSCRDVIAASLKANKQVFCVMQNRYSPPSVWLKEIIGLGKLGQIFQVNVQCIWNRDQRYYEASNWKGTLKHDGGLLFTQFSHFIDTLLWVFGPAEPIRAAFFNDNHPYTEFEDSGVFDFELDRGGRGTFQFTTAAYGQNLESSITILAQNGSIKVGGQYMNEVIACHVKDYEFEPLPASAPPNDYGHYKGSASNHGFVYQNIEDVFSKGSAIDCTVQQGFEVVEFIEKVYKFRQKLKSV